CGSAGLIALPFMLFPSFPFLFAAKRREIFFRFRVGRRGRPESGWRGLTGVLQVVEQQHSRQPARGQSQQQPSWSS
ncbi:MAG: hypothetical protein KIT22_13675, partial [Verrucomicrobiae bacterium]|nr:hypothetical protein [Verrucomicrobiae bacterium]